MSKIAIECHGITKQFNGTLATNDLDLSVQQGDILAVVGPSGCGKTTLLRLIAGFENPDAGEIFIQEQKVAERSWSMPPEQRGVGMVFQESALFPHLTVRQNVSFGLNGQSDKVSIVQKELERVGLLRYENRYPHQLSGGERQRVALARALAPKPVLILLDEPFSNLDAELREVMREEVRDILKSTGTTTLFVTHDQEEALFMGDQLAVFNQGRVEQTGYPEEIFQCPATRFVADFMGQTNFLPANTTSEGLSSEVGFIYQRIPGRVGENIDLVLRPDDVAFKANEAGLAVIDARIYKGDRYIYRLRLPSGHILHSAKCHTYKFPVGSRVDVFINPGHDLAWFNQIHDI
jgi:iron(III) transport system ATP-binding protein